MSPEVTAAIIAAAVSVLTLIGTQIAQSVSRRDTREALKEQHKQLDKTLDEQRVRTLNERFATSAEQLGSDKPAVRLAGVYAMAGLADDWEENRQICVDVLCAYLRMPYEPEPARDAAEPQLLAFQASREVRHTVIRVITAHLQKDAAKSWRGLNLDFTGVAFDGGDFGGAVFCGGMVDFGRARFRGGRVDFGEAEFSGGKVSFTGAQFSGGTVWFVGAQFSGSIVDFDEARFCGGNVYFTRAQFSGRIVDFNRAQFSDGTVNFTGTQFCGSTVRFTEARFSGPPVDFHFALFTEGTVDFSRAGGWSSPPTFPPWPSSMPPSVVILPGRNSDG